MITDFDVGWHLGTHPDNPYKGYFTGDLTFVEGDEKFREQFTWTPGSQGLVWSRWRDKKPDADDKLASYHERGPEAVMWLFRRIKEFYHLVPKEQKTNFHVSVIVELQKILIESFLWKTRTDIWLALDDCLVIPPEPEEQEPSE